MSSLLIYFTIALHWKILHAQCRYAQFGNHVYPVDVCAISGDSATPYSYKFTCSDHGPELVQYSSTGCNGDGNNMVSALLGLNSTVNNYNCYGSSSECQLVDIKFTSCDSGIAFSTTTVVAAICPNNGVKVNCNGDSNSYSQRFEPCVGSTPSPADNNGCDISISSCYGGDVSTDSSVGESGSASESTIILIIAAASGAVVCILILIFICYCKNKKQTNQKRQLQSQLQSQPAPVKFKLVPQVQHVQPPQNTVAKKITFNNAAKAGTTDGGDQLPSYDDVVHAPSAPLAPSASLPQDTGPLPYGWGKAVARDGRVYYQNDITKQTQWNKPTVAVTNSSGGSDVLPYGWRKANASDGRVYYVNDVSKITQWKIPTSSAAPSVELVGGNEPGAMIGDENANNYETNAPPPAFSTDGGPEFNRMETTGVEGGGGGGHIPSAPLMDNDNDMENRDKYREIKDFFYNEVGIEENNDTYIRLLIDNGFDSLEIVKTVTNQDLIDIGVDKLGHRRKIMNEIEKL